jgi:LysR family transcriptional regulator, regulator of abg operon
MRLNQIEEFLAVAEAGSIRAAARLRGLSQPAVTKNIRSLEAELGVPLIRRSAHGAELTASGRLFLTRARIISRELERSRHELAHAGMSHSVTVACAPATAAVLLPPAVVRLRRHSPTIEVRVIEAMPNASLPRVRDGSVDFALGPLLQRPAPPDLVATPLIGIDIAIVVRRGHPLAKARTLAALVDQDWITAGLGRDTALVDGMFREAGLLPPRWAVRCESIPGLIAMVARTDLIATIAKPLSNLAFAGDVLEVVKVRERLATSSVCLFAKRDSPLTPSATLLAKFIRDAARRL